MHYNGQWGAGPMVLRPMRSGGVIPESFGDLNMGLADLGLSWNGYDGEIHWNLEWEDLYAAAIRRKEGEMTAHGVLRTVTGERTGRSPNDRYIVKLHESKISSTAKGLTAEDVWWGDVNRPITKEFISKMGEGVPILDTITRKCFVKQTHKKQFKIILTQGLNRQIRRMCEYLNFRVVKLQRIRIMNIKLDTESGIYRDLNQREIKSLKKLTEDSKKHN